MAAAVSQILSSSQVTPVEITSKLERMVQLYKLKQSTFPDKLSDAVLQKAYCDLLNLVIFELNQYHSSHRELVLNRSARACFASNDCDLSKNFSESTWYRILEDICNQLRYGEYMSLYDKSIQSTQSAPVSHPYQENHTPMTLDELSVEVSEANEDEMHEFENWADQAARHIVAMTTSSF